MAETLLVSVGAGRAGQAALRWAIHRAEQVEVEVALIRAASLEWEVPGGPEVSHRTESEELLRVASELLVDAGVSVVSAQVVGGTPVPVLIEASDAADLLVLGSSRGSKLASAAAMTVPLLVGGRAHCTAVVIPAGWIPHDGDVVVGWEETAAAERAVAAAAGEAVRMRRSLAIVHAWDVPQHSDAPQAAATAGLRENAARSIVTLHEVAERVRAAHTRLMVSEHAEEGEALVVMSAAALSASALFIGSAGHSPLAESARRTLGHRLVVAPPAPAFVVGPGTVEEEPVSHGEDDPC